MIRADAGAIADGSRPVDGSGAADGSVPVDGGWPVDLSGSVDASVSVDSSLPDLPPLAPLLECSALQGLADRGLLTQRRTRRVLFAPDRSWLALRVAGESPPGIGYPDDLIRVSLPSGEVTPIISRLGTVEALGPGGALLVGAMGTEGRDLIVADDSGLRTIAAGVCDCVAAPDGSRVYAIRDCNAASGAVDVVDVVSGGMKRLATDVLAGSTVVSPGSTWGAFVVRHSSDGGSSPSVVNVADAGGRVYALSTPTGGSELAFISDRLLLFRSGGEIRGHVPGTGDTSYLVAVGRDPGLHGYEVSPDGSWLLGARVPEYNYYSPADYFVGDLYAIRLDGSGEILLTSDLYPYWARDFGPRVFGFGPDGASAIYNDSKTMGAWAVGVRGDAPTKLSDDAAFLSAPAGDRVALLEPSFPKDQSRLRVVTLPSGADLLSFDAGGGIGIMSFLPDGSGVLFVESTADGQERLRFMSPAHPDSVAIGEWRDTKLELGGPTALYYSYPVDPTGCFTIVDTDQAPGPGTRLVLVPN